MMTIIALHGYIKYIIFKLYKCMCVNDYYNNNKKCDSLLKYIFFKIKLENTYTNLHLHLHLPNE